MPTPKKPARRHVSATIAGPGGALRAGLARLRGRRILVVGDILLDQYIWGRVDRVSPEAPVPVVLRTGHTNVLGGALNVARNIAAAGGRAVVVGVVGADPEGRLISDLMEDAGLPRSGLVVHPARRTTRKARIMSGGQQLLRLDVEEAGEFDAATTRKLVAAVARLARGCDGVILSDYRKGVLTRRVIESAVRAARRLQIPVVVDPKSHDFRLYKGADWLTPNLKEASAAAGRPLARPAEIEREGRRLTRLYGGRGIVITQGHEGLTLVGGGAPVRIPAQAREVFDVTGAGDTLIAHFTLGLAAGFAPADAARIGNAAAGIAVSKLGAVTVSPQELAAALGAGEGLSKVRTLDDLRVHLDQLRAQGRRIVLTNGCFDLFHAGHVGLLERARALGDVLVVALNTDASVRRVKGAPRPILPESDRAAVLSALPAVDYLVFFDEDTPERVLRELRPDVLAKGRQDGVVVGAAIVRANGGTVIELPLLKAVSTREVVRRLRKTGS